MAIWITLYRNANSGDRSDSRSGSPSLVLGDVPLEAGAGCTHGHFSDGISAGPKFKVVKAARFKVAKGALKSWQSHSHSTLESMCIRMPETVRNGSESQRGQSPAEPREAVTME